MQAIADQIRSQLAVSSLQVVPILHLDPTPPSIDVYPAETFQERLGMGKGNNSYFFTVRARVDTADNEAGQRLLLAMMDSQAAESVEAAIEADRTLGGTVGYAGVDSGPSGYGAFDVPNGQMLGCTWTVKVLP